MANGDQSDNQGQQPPQFTTAQIQALLGASGMSADQVKNMPPSALNFYQQFPNAVGSGIASTVPGQRGGVSIGQLGSLLSAFGGAGSQSQAAPSAPGGVSMDPTNAATNLGAAALSRAGFGGPQGGFAVYNPTPGQASAKGGIGQYVKPTTTSAVPTVQGPNVPGIFGAAPMPPAATGGRPTPMPPANAAGPMQPTPYATAPPAPGVQTPGVPPATGMMASPGIEPLSAAHTSALADAGKALYSHFGGDPNSAGPGDIANFHTQLASAIGGMGGGGAAPGPGGAGAPIKPMASGGLVPGRGNQDSVPALLTPGEYVIPKQEVQQMGLRPPVRMAEGGFVTDDSNQPPEARRKTLSTPSSATSTTASAQPSQPSNTGSQDSSSPAPQNQWSTIAENLARAHNNAIAASQGQSPGGTGYSPAAGGYVGISPGTGQSGYIYPTQAAATAGGATGQGAIGMGPNMSQVSGAVGDLASGLAAAAQKYADSFKPWQIQKSAIPDPTANRAPPVQLSQQAAPQQRQQPANPYMAMIAGANPSAAYYSNYFPNMA